ncbi:MAG: hypothetical protein ACJ739_11685 [Acidimicrobiales bacterium]
MQGRPRRAAVRTTALVLVAVVAACSGGGGDDPSSGTATSPSTTPTTAESTTTTAALVGKPLVVAEQGVSSFPDLADPQSTLGGYGVVILNPDPKLMATGVRVVTRILDPAGGELLVDRTLLNGILPGQKMAVGRTLIEPIEEPTSLDVKLEVTAWLPPASTTGKLVAEEVVTEPEEGGGAVTRFKVRSTWPELENGVDVTALYRAADGRILSAETTSLDVAVGDPTPGQVRLLSPIPDLAKTDVLVGRGFAALTAG